MKVLITGAGGFAGRHLARELVSESHTVAGFDLQFSTPVKEASGSFTGNLLKMQDLSSTVKSARPDACVHLGGISFVPSGATDPDLMHAVNYGGTLNLLNALREHAPKCRTVIVTTAQVYGAPADTGPIKEDTPFAPSTEYGRSKAEADKAALDYAGRYGMHIITVRPNNHTGPGQSPKFVVPSFASQIKAIARGEQDPVISTGNLESIRDFSDVRDITRAYRLLVEKGRPGEAYNVSAGNMMSVRSILNKLCELAKVRPKIEIDRHKYRPTDRSPLLDTSKIVTDTGWEPVFTIDQTLQDMLAAF